MVCVAEFCVAVFTALQLDRVNIKPSKVIGSNKYFIGSLYSKDKKQGYIFFMQLKKRLIFVY